MKGSEGFKHIALKRFEVFLDQHSYRKTSERFAVLEELYALDRHIDVEGLFVVMRNKEHSISRATIYNTLDLLVLCGLAVKHQFREQNALYEQALVYQHHTSLISGHHLLQTKLAPQARNRHHPGTILRPFSK